MISASLHRYAIPFHSAIDFKGQTLNRREGLILQLQADGRTGLGEIAPLPQFSTETLEQAQQQTLALLPALCQSGVLDDGATLASVRFGISCALWQLQQPRPRRVSSPYPLLTGNDEQIVAAAAGAATLKLKVARRPVEQEVRLIYRLLAANPNCRFRLDANQRWSREQAEDFIAAIPLDRVDYIEEPTASLDDNLRLVSQFGLPLALDETTQQPDYRYQFIAGVKALVLKPTLIGDIATLQRLVEQAELDGVQVTLSSSFETNVGLTAIGQLAAELTPEQAPGIDTLDALQQDLLLPQRSDTPCLSLQQLTPLWP
ncbi:o-succinylbenzoate synthase [Ferrimonas kyonanensis]|uniref:o-succinylbenzoate synthase n=1 Tax=Ferrimonas kyonanensis TaxID=364763 RepID=UPI00041F7F66|nr:o-succinylbenzoate synthase [Ferrimonas kyonanensis]